MNTQKTAKKRDWAAYNKAAIQRGSLELWIDADALSQWYAPPPTEGRLGRPRFYSDAAIEMLLTVRAVFRLNLRATVGFAEWLLKQLHIDLPVPCFATLSNRAKTLAVALNPAPGEKRIVVLDSTGLKVYGEGEWKVRQHGVSKRRDWRKLHLAIDADTHEVVACELTDSETDDGSQAEPLLDAAVADAVAAGVPAKKAIDIVSADGAYDSRKVHDAIAKHGAAAVIPPRRNAKIWVHGNSKIGRAGPHPRDEALRMIRRRGRDHWARASGYTRRSMAETGVGRHKRIMGPELSSRLMETQRTEAKIKCKALNKMARLGFHLRAA